VYNALQIIDQQKSKDPVSVLEQAVRNATPQLEVKPRRVGGATYQVPVEVRSDRALSLAMRWLIKSARARPGKSMAEKLAAELVVPQRGRGQLLKSAMRLIKWLKPIEPLPTINGEKSPLVILILC